MLDELKKLKPDKLNRLIAHAKCLRTPCQDNTEILRAKDRTVIDFIRSNLNILTDEHLNSIDKTIIGMDDREELFSVSKIKKTSSKKAVALISEHFFDTNGKVDLRKTHPYTEKAPGQKLSKYCERFYLQPMAVCSTGTAISDNYVLITKHTLRACKEVQKMKLVYGYWYEDDMNITNTLTIDIEEVIKLSLDLALIKTRQRIPECYQVEVSEKEYKVNDKVFSAGYPGPEKTSGKYLGIPLKVVSQGKISFIEGNKAHYYGHLDVNNRCSGSPVFDEKTQKLVGIIAKTSLDHFRWNPACDGFVSCYYDASVPKGIKLISNETILNQLNKIKL